MTSHRLYWWQNLHYMWYCIHCIYDFICYMWHHTHYVYDMISTIYNITHTMCMRTEHLYLTSHLLYLCHHTRWIDDIKPTVHMTPQPHIWHHMQYIRHTIHSLWNHSCVHDFISTLFMASLPLYMWITAIICLSSQQLF